MEKGSVIESIEIARKSGVGSSSEYSVILNNEIVYVKGDLVNTKTDIFIQQGIMQKIIRYIEMFSDDLKAQIDKLRSKSSLFTQNK